MANYNSRGQDALLPYFASDNQKGKGEIIFDNRHHNIAAGAAIAAQEALYLGTTFECEDGRKFRYVQMTGGAAALGLCVMRNADVAEDTVSSSSDLLKIETGGVDTTWVAGAFAGDWVQVDDGTGKGQCRRILMNDTTTLHLDRPLTTALAIGTSDITIIRPYHVRITATAPLDIVQGIASVLNPNAGTGPGTNAIDEDSFGWIQVSGFCEHIIMHTAAAAGVPISASTNTAGRADIIAATEDQGVFTAFGFILGQVAAAGETAPGLLTGCGLV
jgi:hypothetical protein